MIVAMSIDWKMIWKEHSPYYRDGKFVLELLNGEKVFFEPGPAFGDGSHPTTNLMLEGIPSLVEGKTVVDLGAGSGILSMAALRYGAGKVYAYEIDEDAILSMKTNLLLNGIEDIFINEPCPSFDILLVNMISSEQEIAFNAHPNLVQKDVLYLVSGILENETEEMLSRFPGGRLLAQSVNSPWQSLLIKT